MTLHYKYVFDSAYCKVVIARFYGQRPLPLRLPVQFAIPVVIVMWLWSSWQKMDASWPNVMALIAAGTVVIGAGVYLVKIGVLQRLKRNSEFGLEVTITISAQGLTASSSNGGREYAWSAYPRCVRYADGILLMRGGAIRWLPDASLQDGSAEQATDLVRSKTKMRDLRHAAARRST
ncbi:MAG TPA: YcxB family protein [Steroidobacteraceae bacterium]